MNLNVKNEEEFLFNQETLGFAFKATYAEINGVATELFKDPITDPGKKSHKGLMKLVKLSSGEYVTLDQQENDEGGELVEVFKDGKVVREYTLEEIRERSNI